MISPPACGALFSARTTPQQWNPGGTLVEPWWNPRGTLPQNRPGPPRSLSGLRPQSFQLLGKKVMLEHGEQMVMLYTFPHVSPNKTETPNKHGNMPPFFSGAIIHAVRVLLQNSLQGILVLASLGVSESTGDLTCYHFFGTPNKKQKGS